MAFKLTKWSNIMAVEWKNKLAAFLHDTPSKFWI
jgi:hypothetical protein